MPEEAWQDFTAHLEESGLPWQVVHRYRLRVVLEADDMSVGVSGIPWGESALAYAAVLLGADELVRLASNSSLGLASLNGVSLSDQGVASTVELLFSESGLPVPPELQEWDQLVMFPAILAASVLDARTQWSVFSGPPGSPLRVSSDCAATLATLLSDTSLVPRLPPDPRPPDLVSSWVLLRRVLDSNLLSVAQAL